MSTINFSKLDRNFDVPEVADGWAWYDGSKLTIEGRGWADPENPFARLPPHAESIVRPPIWSGSRCSTGLVIRFVTDATEISARWTLISSILEMNHMPATGVSGLDLYVWDIDRWRWIGLGRPNKPNEINQEGPLTTGLRTGEKVFQLYLPLYNGVQNVQLGIPKENSIRSAPRPPEQTRPICFYGTSIVQGGCASRPGMAYTAILGRRLDRPTINLGFSGQGKMDLEIAPLLGELDAAAYVLDALPNMTAELVVERAHKFIEILRHARPKTPIILVEGITRQRAPMQEPSQHEHTLKNAALRTVYNALKESGYENVWLVPGDTLLGDDGDGTVDGTHATDLGFKRMADAIEPTLRTALA